MSEGYDGSLSDVRLLHIGLMFAVVSCLSFVDRAQPRAERTFWMEQVADNLDFCTLKIQKKDAPYRDAVPTDVRDSQEQRSHVKRVI
jgi:hypothetical protein